MQFITLRRDLRFVIISRVSSEDKKRDISGFVWLYGHWTKCGFDARIFFVEIKFRNYEKFEFKKLE